MNDAPTERGARLRRAREHRDWTQQTLAEKVGLTRESIAQYESGTKTPALDTCKALADALEVRGGWLAWGESPAPRWTRATPRRVQPAPARPGR